MNRGFFSLYAILLFFTSHTLSAQPTVFGHWTFEQGQELTDLTGNFGELQLNGATISDGALDVGIDAWATAANYTGPDIVGKTLIAWVRLDELATMNNGLSGGSALTIDKISVDEFDAMAFGEQEANHWRAGSDFFRRTQILNDPLAEETTTGELVQIAMAYECNGMGVNVFRNGVLIGDYQYAANTVAPTYTAGDTEIFFGLRHRFPNGNFPTNPWLDAKIEEAMIIGECATGEELMALVITPAIPTMNQWSLLIMTMLLAILGLVFLKLPVLRIEDHG